MIGIYDSDNNTIKGYMERWVAGNRWVFEDRQEGIFLPIAGEEKADYVKLMGRFHGISIGNCSLCDSATEENFYAVTAFLLRGAVVVHEEARRGTVERGMPSRIVRIIADLEGGGKEKVKEVAKRLALPFGE